jgi:hypothetical protein
MRTTNSIILTFALAVLAGCASRPSAVVELPRPNSGTFTFAQAEARKSDIYSLVQTGMKTDWKNPYMGFSVHITSSDEVVVYSSTYFRAGEMNIREFQDLLITYAGTLEGNPLGVLVTCERDPRSSVTLPRVLDLLFKPYVQVFYERRT